MVIYQGFEIGDDGNIKKTEEFETDARICIKCGDILDENNVAKTEEKEITSGALVGRKSFDIWCASCGQRHIFVQPV